MFKALYDKAEIIILDIQDDKEAADRLRELGRKGKLLCPECGEQVRVRAGEKYRYHFAHKSVGKCALRSEIPAILAARSIIYGWLKSKEQLPLVTTEKTVSGVASQSGLPRPIDCYAETGKKLKISYWVFEHGVRKVADRSVMSRVFASAGMVINWVFLSTMLKYKKNSSNKVLLSTTERDFSSPSKYDAPYNPHGNTLHYLDIEKSTLTTFRGLLLDHPPQEYRFYACLTTPIEEILIDPGNGEFVHQGEYEVLQQRRREQEQLVTSSEEKTHWKDKIFSQTAVFFEDQMQEKKREFGWARRSCETCNIGKLSPALCKKCDKNFTE